MQDVDARRVEADAAALGLAQGIRVTSARGYLLQGPELTAERVERLARELFADTVVEQYVVAPVGDRRLTAPAEANPAPSADESSRRPAGPQDDAATPQLVQVLLKPGVMDPVAQSAEAAAGDFGWDVEAVRTLRKYWIAGASG
ncbi:MAG: hypothetical protein DCC67_20715, partial [Planctomycetota bacterium]